MEAPFAWVPSGLKENKGQKRQITSKEFIEHLKIEPSWLFQRMDTVGMKVLYMKYEIIQHVRNLRNKIKRIFIFSIEQPWWTKIWLRRWGSKI